MLIHISLLFLYFPHKSDWTLSIPIISKLSVNSLPALIFLSYPIIICDSISGANTGIPAHAIISFLFLRYWFDLYRLVTEIAWFYWPYWACSCRYDGIYQKIFITALEDSLFSISYGCSNILYCNSGILGTRAPLVYDPYLILCITKNSHPHCLITHYFILCFICSKGLR